MLQPAGRLACWSARIGGRRGSGPARLPSGLVRIVVSAWLARRFSLAQPPSRAQLYVTALGCYEAHLNGQVVGDGLLRPGWTDTTRRVQYQVIDVTKAVRVGDNVLGAMVAPGWFAGRISLPAVSEDRSFPDIPAPELLCQLEVELPGGRMVVVTDERWQWRESAIATSDLYDGECWDLRLLDADWDLPGWPGDRLAAGRAESGHGRGTSRRADAPGAGRRGSPSIGHLAGRWQRPSRLGCQRRWFHAARRGRCARSAGRGLLRGDRRPGREPVPGEPARGRMHRPVPLRRRGRGGTGAAVQFPRLPLRRGSRPVIAGEPAASRVSHPVYRPGSNRLV